MAMAVDESTTVRVAPLELWPQERQAFVEDHRIVLTQRESQLLDVLAAHPGHVLTREQLHRAVWRRAPDPRDRSVHVYVAKLRHKLWLAAPRWQFLHTHYGLGYRFEPEERDE
jgi:DNA-binding response OmpR family regulator